MSNIVLKINKKTVIIIIIGVLLLAVFLLSVFVVYLLFVKKTSFDGIQLRQVEPSSQSQKISPSAQAGTYSYNKKVSLVGSVKKFYYGGPDKSVLTLVLDEPINMQLGSSEFEKAYKNQNIFQFINEKNLPLSSYEDQVVKITGELMASHTAHHKTDVLLAVESISSQNSQKYKPNTFRGFYTHYDKMDWGDVPVTCDALTVIGGDQSLIFKYKAKVEEGNGINYVDTQGRLVVNLNLDYNFDEAVRKTITSSTPGSPVEVGVLEHNVAAGGVPACFSFFEVLSVN